MEDTNLLGRWDRVAAPPDFEERVMAELARRRQALPQMRRTRLFRLSLAGAAAALLVAFVGSNVFIGRPGGPSGLASGGAAAVSGVRPALSITEVLDYGNEVRSVSSDPRPVYILEQVSFASNTIVKY
jgi:hypothetical protein